MSREVPMGQQSSIQQGSESDLKRIKKRNTYIYKNWNYDLTEITTEKNTLVEKSYEFELEVVGEVSSVLSSLNKIIDVIKMCEEVGELQFIRV